LDAWGDIIAPKKQKEFCVNKSISLPFAFVERVTEEMEITGQDFSTCILALARIGLQVKKDQRAREIELSEEESRLLRK
jgi:hypothetical protein